MSLSAAALKVMLSKGLSLSDACEIADAIEEEPQSGRTKAAERMARYRANRVQNGMPAGFSGAAHMSALTERDGEKCVYCAVALGTSVDHMHPIYKGGTDHQDNLALACAACNCGKAGKILSADGTEIKSPTARAAFVRYVREHVPGTDVLEHVPPVRTGARVVTSFSSSLRSEEVGVGGVERGRDVPADDWPEGKASDHADQLVQLVASPWLDPCKSPDLVTTRGRIAAWRRDGASWEHDVVSVVTGLSANRRSRISSWKFFDEAIARSIAANRQALTIPEASNDRPRHDPRNDRAARRGVWAEVLAEERGEGAGGTAGAG